MYAFAARKDSASERLVAPHDMALLLSVWAYGMVAPSLFIVKSSCFFLYGISKVLFMQFSQVDTPSRCELCAETGSNTPQELKFLKSNIEMGFDCLTNCAV
jgi:hypothetical protein